MATMWHFELAKVHITYFTTNIEPLCALFLSAWWHKSICGKSKQWYLLLFYLGEGLDKRTTDETSSSWKGLWSYEVSWTKNVYYFNASYLSWIWYIIVKTLLFCFLHSVCWPKYNLFSIFHFFISFWHKTGEWWCKKITQMLV